MRSPISVTQIPHWENWERKGMTDGQERERTKHTTTRGSRTANATKLAEVREAKDTKNTATSSPKNALTKKKSREYGTQPISQVKKSGSEKKKEIIWAQVSFPSLFITFPVSNVSYLREKRDNDEPGEGDKSRGKKRRRKRKLVNIQTPGAK